MQILTQIAQARAEYERLMNEAKEPMKGWLQTFIGSNPTIQGISWEQYTPYFNDGEPCVFSVNYPTFYFGSMDELGEDSEASITPYSRKSYDPDEMFKNYVEIPDDGERDYWEAIRPHLTPEVRAGIAKFLEEFHGLGDDVFKTVFGDHAQVIVTRDGVTVDEYEHE